MNHSESMTKIAPALLKAQEIIGAAKKGAVNPFFHSKYADLGSVMEACKKELNDNGVSVLQLLVTENGEPAMETVLLHESGEWVSGTVVMPKGADIQKQGAIISYMRRYALASTLFIPAEDDDGNTATNKQVAPKTTSYDDLDGLLPPEEDVVQPRYINTPQEASRAVSGASRSGPTPKQRAAIGAIVLRQPDLRDESAQIKTMQEASDFIGKYGYQR